MKCRVIEDKPGKFEPQVRERFCWYDVRRYAQFHPHMNDDEFNYYYPNIESAKAALVEFSEELRRAEKRKRQIHVTGEVTEIEFLEKI